MTRRPTFLILIGTRPEAIKLAPLVRELVARGHQPMLVTTGQHPTMADAMLAEVGFRAHVDLGIHRPGLAPADLLAAILKRLPGLLAAIRPRVVLVQGDTVSTLGGALAAAYAGVPLAHVEAGLRTGDVAEPFPEEHHRRLIGSIASWHFAPTRQAAEALVSEGVPADAILVTGNTGIDALLATVERIGRNPKLAAGMAARFPAVAAAGPPILLATVHRRENVGARLPGIARGLEAVAAAGTMRVVLPLHPNPVVQQLLRHRLGGFPNVQLLPAVGHAEMVWLMQHSRLLLTDSGGLQEEAPALGLRTLVLREATERMQAVDCGVARLIGADGAAIAPAVAEALAQPPCAPTFPFGDGQASVRIADHLEQWLFPAARSDRQHPHRRTGLAHQPQLARINRSA